ncbi:GDP-mannose 4,6-dehydratase [Treponema socranskii]|uniref:GDP-mannose 4,6-dehydratase n=1 Tax=Treponema socranskii TaxID=53419 RepID=UPI0028715D19|nr:GDP-mannose 4,6-dehydratase [Treponema socranskii]MDR9859859.1 GDP-mannose 4,6-dehydratase [Treponema socranskii]
MSKIDLKNKTILVTGSSGFIGSNLCKVLFEQFEGITIVGIDNMNDYYDVSLKEYRLAQLKNQKNYVFIKGDISDKGLVNDIFEKYQPAVVVNLAAQVGVRYSITNPDAYIRSNLIGFFNILEACRHSVDGGKNGVGHLVYASSSSVYGSNKKIPYSTEDKVDNPVSLYAATKKSNELFAHAYSKLYRIPSTGLRFFTVYGPAGRPDMAYFKFTNKLVKGEAIQIYNNGDMKRDFTFIDDIVKGIIAVMQKTPKLSDDGVPYKVYNIGNSQPEDLLAFVNTLEECLTEAGVIDEPVEKEFLPMQLGDVYQTFADTSELEKDFGFKPQTTIKEGLTAFAKWYKKFYK